MEEAKGVEKQHWMNRYLERLKSEEGLSAEEIHEEENARRASEGLPLLKFNSIGRTLNTFGYPKSGTRHKHVAPARTVRIETVIKEIKRKVEKVSELIEEEKLSHVEEEFVWLFMENYPESQIADMLQLDNGELEKIKEKLHLD
jgi:hypothetical protein